MSSDRFVGASRLAWCHNYWLYSTQTITQICDLPYWKSMSFKQSFPLRVHLAFTRQRHFCNSNRLHVPVGITPLVSDLAKWVTSGRVWWTVARRTWTTWVLRTPHVRLWNKIGAPDWTPQQPAAAATYRALSGWQRPRLEVPHLLILWLKRLQWTLMRLRLAERTDRIGPVGRLWIHTAVRDWVAVTWVPTGTKALARSGKIWWKHIIIEFIVTSSNWVQRNWACLNCYGIVRRCMNILDFINITVFGVKVLAIERHKLANRVTILSQGANHLLPRDCHNASVAGNSQLRWIWYTNLKHVTIVNNG